MIKINLLPHKRAKRSLAAREPGGNELYVGLGALVVAAAMVFLLVDRPKRHDLTELLASNAQLQQQLIAKNKLLRDYPALQKAADQAEARAKAIHDLDQAKVVPANVLQELGKILTAGQLPTMTKEMSRRTDSDPNRRFDLAWDPTHVWLTSFKDQDGKFTLEGGAQAEVDVTQFSKRLQASAYFMDVAPSSETRTTDPASGIEYYQFTITGKVAY